MKTRALPGTDLELSVVGFGCWAMGGMWWGDDVDDATSKAAVHAALDHGINWFDTAPLYGYGHADEVLKAALDGRGGDAIIATKVGVRFKAASGHAQSDLTPDHIVSDTEASLKRLGLDCIDLLQVHWPCELQTPLEASLDALEDLREQGKIRWYGLCNYDAKAVAEARKRPGMVALQTPYSLLRRELEGALQDACTSTPGAIGILAYEPLCRGLLTGKFKTPPTFPESDMRSWDERFQGPRFLHAQALVRDLARVGQRVNAPVSAIAIGWVLAQSGMTSAIVGAKRPDQVIANVQAGRLVGQDKLWSVVERVAAVHGGWKQ